MNSKKSRVFLTIILTVFLLGTVYAEGDDSKKANTLNKPAGTPIRAYMNINNISTIIKNTGISDIDVAEANSGLIFPKGSGKTAVFESGLLWGAIVDNPDIPNIGGSTYREGLQGGWIDANGNVVSPDDPRSRIYRVRPDVFPGGPEVDVSSEAVDEGKSVSDVRAQYETDWTEWPGDLGAPYFDGNGNGQYDNDPASGDIPGVPGADQTIWYVANDQESALTQDLYGTLPMGIEMQATFWAYRQAGALGNMFFRRYVIINKTNILPDGPKTFTDMYVSMWSDVDLGNSTDDFAGSDTLLSVVYCYNGTANDPTYAPLPPPAVGFDFFQGPLLDGVAGEDRNKNGVDDAEDFAIFKNQIVGPGKINLPMTAAYYFTRGDATVTDPVLGSPTEGAVRFYRFMQGRVGLTDAPFVDPTTGHPTTYVLNGDPVARTGWIDGMLQSPGDRRIGSASGPFNMAPGDTQEVVVAQIMAGAIPGVDRISAVSLMKFYDQVAQVAYDNFFDLPTPPPAPVVDVVELDREIVLDWSKDPVRYQATESSNVKGYAFQGYNIYQLPSASASVSQGVRIATYDVNDGTGKINDLVFDPATGSVVTLPVQFGNDTGIKRFISIKNDAIKQIPLVNGIRYYFAVTAYNFNPDLQAVPNNLETPIQILTVVPRSADPGYTYGEGSGSPLEITHSGTADGGPTVTIVDPTATTGNEYEVYFSERQEIRNASGDWVPAATIAKRLSPNSPDTLTGSTIDISAVYGITGSDVELHCVLNLESSDGDWCDGIMLTLPEGVSIINVPSFDALNTDAVNGGTIDPVIVGNTIILGDNTHPYTGNGPFEGGEEWIIYVQPFTAPISIDWIIYDDGWAGGPIDAEGTTTINEVGSLSRLAKYWNLRNVTTGAVKLENQSIIAGTDIYPDRDNIPTNPGQNASTVIDGFQVNMNVNYAAPLSFFNITVNGEDLSPTDGSAGVPGQRWGDADGLWSFTDYGFFGFPTGTSFDANGYGTQSIDDLQQDYEFRWTGVAGDTVVNGQTIVITKEGGSMATFYGARQWDMGNHPLNPNPGSQDPFLLRVPFEVWNKDQGIQVNYQFYDRSQSDPTASPFYVWFTTNRTYGEILNTPYDGAHIANGSTGGSDADLYTWNTVWYASEWTTGDVVELFYVNPIQIGVDTYRFTTTPAVYSADLAKDQLQDVNVFPNPYYGINSEELNKYNRFVTFSHLPPKATIRIFNLAGVLVKTIQKDDPSQFTPWDLANESGLPVASGLYIAYLELSDNNGVNLGTKILKLAIIQEQQVLDRF